MYHWDPHGRVTGKATSIYPYSKAGLSQCSRLSMPRTHDSCDSADSIESISAHDALRAQTAVCPVQLGIGYCRYVAVAVQVPVFCNSAAHGIPPGPLNVVPARNGQHYSIERIGHACRSIAHCGKADSTRMWVGALWTPSALIVECVGPTGGRNAVHL